MNDKTSSIIVNVSESFGGFPQERKLKQYSRFYLDNNKSVFRDKIKTCLLTPFQHKPGDGHGISLLNMHNRIDIFIFAVFHYQAHKKLNDKIIFDEYEILDKEILDMYDYDSDKIARIKPLINAAIKSYRVLNDEIIGKSKVMEDIKHKIWNACFGENLFVAYNYHDHIRHHDILIIGEPGTGKELFTKAVAQAVFWNELSAKPKHESVNISAFPTTLLSGILFGTKKGVGTNILERKGLIASAHNCT
jgi:transcriptional regulator with PAS, ATPase and Fis domain